MQAFDAGLVLLPSALVLMVLMPIAGNIYDRFGARWPVVIGLLIMAYGQYLLAGITVNTPENDLMWWISIRNIGTGLAMMPLTTAGISSLPAALTSAGSGMNNVAQRVSSAVSVAIVGALMASQSAQLISDDSAGLTPANTAAEQLAGHSQQGVLGLYQQLAQQSQTTTYANAFLTVAVLCLIGAGLALFLQSGRPAADGPRVVEF